MPLRAFVDANIFKFAATALTRLEGRDEDITINGRSYCIRLHKFVTVNPNENIRDAKLLQEAESIRDVAEAAKQGKLELLTHQETIWESHGLPDMDSTTGRLYGAPLRTIPYTPMPQRVLGGGHLTPRQWKEVYVNAISDKRFDELKVATGAAQKAGKKTINQTLDAFHLWQAELARADVFLSLDFKLARMVERARCKPPPRVVTPTELLSMTRGEA